MIQINRQTFLAYWLTIIVAMALNIIPWSSSVLLLVPDWVLLTLIYWALAMPESASVGKAWFAGLLVDVLTGQLLGQFALSYAFSVFLCEKQHKRLRQYPIIQQSLSICAILLIARFLVFWIEHVNHQVLPISFWLPVLTGGLMWPVVSFILRHIRLS